MATITHLYIGTATMQEIIDLLAKLKSGESKKYSLLRIAIANYFEQLGMEKHIHFDIRTKKGKQHLLALASQLILEYESNTEEIEQRIDKEEVKQEKRERSINNFVITHSAGQDNFFGAVAALAKDNPNLFTAEGLGALGNEADCKINFERKKGKENPVYPSLDWSILAKLVGGLDGEIDESVFRRLIAAPSEFITEAVPEPTADDSPMTQIFKTMFTKDDLVRMDATRRIYSNIRMLQDSYQISGLTSDEFDCRGLKISYLTEYGLLNLQPKDARKLWRQVSKLTDYFLQLAAMDSPKYNLSRVDFDDYEQFGDRGEDLPTTYSQVREYASKAKAVWICHESTQWEEKTQKVVSSTRGEMEVVMGHPVNRPEEPDTIELHLTMDWKDFKTADISDSVTFRLTHPHRD